MEMQFKNEIKKLADIVVWADSIIRAAGYNEEKYKSDAASAYCHVKAYELWKIKTVVLEAIDRHTTYTNALNKDIADKAAKIDLLEKELDGRKAGYHALKAQLDHMTALEENWYANVQELVETCKSKNEEIEKLKKEIEGRKEGYEALKELMDTKYISIDEHNMIVDQFKEEIKSITKSRDIWFDTAGGHSNTIIEQSNTIKKLEEKVKHQKENLDGINKTLEIRTKENESLISVKNNQDREIEAHESENARLSEKIAELERQNEYLKKELDQTCTCKELDLKGHQSRETALVNALADKNDEIKELKTEVTQYKEFIDGLNRDLNYWKDQERIRTNQLRATESKVEELYKRIENLKLANRIAVNNVYGLASASIREEDDYGRAGFKRYIEHLIEEEERAVPERFKARLNEEITAIFEKEEETEVKGVGRTSSGRYPWGAEVHDIPCGEDSIE